jgi:hypothetical protein
MQQPSEKTQMHRIHSGGAKLNPLESMIDDGLWIIEESPTSATNHPSSIIHHP